MVGIHLAPVQLLMLMAPDGKLNPGMDASPVVEVCADHCTQLKDRSLIEQYGVVYYRTMYVSTLLVSSLLSSLQTSATSATSATSLLSCFIADLLSTGIMKAVEDYEALAKDPDVDIVYVSNIHPAHKDASILMMNHGKHVLCEKPLAVSPHCLA